MSSAEGKKLKARLESMTVADIISYAKSLGLTKTSGKKKADLISYVVKEWEALPEEEQKLPESQDPAYQKLKSIVQKYERSVARLEKILALKKEALAEYKAKLEALDV